MSTNSNILPSLAPFLWASSTKASNVLRSLEEVRAPRPRDFQRPPLAFL